MKVVALFGGSFNPITISHATVACEILRLKLAEEVWYVPSDIHPFSQTQKRKANQLPFEKRVEMLQACIYACPKDIRDKMRICEIEKGTANLTKDTIQALRQIYPQYDFVWITGSDCVNEWHLWEGIEWLLENISFVVYPRKGVVENGSHFWELLKAPPNIVLTEQEVTPTSGSSTEARKNPRASGLLFPSVLEIWERAQ